VENRVSREYAFSTNEEHNYKQKEDGLINMSASLKNTKVKKNKES